MLTGDDLGMGSGCVTPASAASHRDKVREEAQLVLRLSLELSGVHLGIRKRLRCFPGFSSVRKVQDEHEVSV